MKKVKEEELLGNLAAGVVKLEKIGNEKIFFHVFPTLKVENDIKMLFSDVEVSMITTNSKRGGLRVHIFSTHLIQKKHIWQMEQKIKEQLFPAIRGCPSAWKSSMRCPSSTRRVRL